MKGSSSSAPTGLFSSPGPRGYRSAEAQVLRQQPMDGTEVQRVACWTQDAAIVETQNGRVLTVPRGAAERMGFRQ